MKKRWNRTEIEENDKLKRNVSTMFCLGSIKKVSNTSSLFKTYQMLGEKKC